MHHIARWIIIITHTDQWIKMSNSQITKLMLLLNVDHRQIKALLMELLVSLLCVDCKEWALPRNLSCKECHPIYCDSSVHTTLCSSLPAPIKKEWSSSANLWDKPFQLLLRACASNDWKKAINTASRGIQIPQGATAGVSATHAHFAHTTSTRNPVHFNNA